MNKYLLNASIIVIFIYLLFASCAQTGGLTGGDKDSIPPIPVKFAPEFAKTNFKEKQVRVKFNEYFELKDIRSQFIVSPPLEETPDVKVKGKYLEIELTSELAENTTYNFDFNEAVADYAEGNILHGFQYVCSTGDNIDSLQISGKLVDAQTLEPIEGAFVYLYRMLNDTTPSKVLPDYLAKTNKEGVYNIRNIASDTYQVFALMDMNSNLLYDQASELIAFDINEISPSLTIEQTIDTLLRDSIIYDKKKKNAIDTVQLTEIKRGIIYHYLPDSIELFMFDEDDDNQFISTYKREKPGQIIIAMNRLVSEDFSVVPIQKLKTSDYLVEWNEERDSLIYWIKNEDFRLMDTLSFQVNYLSQDSLKNWVKTSDTLYFGYDFEKDLEKGTEEKGKEPMVKSSDLKINFKNLDKNYLDLGQGVLFESNNPLVNVNKQFLYLYEMADSLVTKYIKHKRPSAEYSNPESDGLISAILESKETVFALFKNEKYSELAVKGLNFNLSKAPEFTENSDSLLIKFNTQDISKLDTLKFILSYKMKALVGEQPFADTLSLAVSKSVFEVFGTKVPFELKPIDKASRAYSVKFDGKNDGRLYSFIFSPKFASDVFGNVNDSLNMNFTIRPDDYYGNLILNLSNQPQKLKFILQNDKGKTIKEVDNIVNNKLEINILPPGNYYIRAFIDENKNGKWDTGDFVKRKQPEKVFLFSKPIVIRSAWDTEEDWLFDN